MGWEIPPHITPHEGDVHSNFPGIFLFLEPLLLLAVAFSGPLLRGSSLEDNFLFSLLPLSHFSRVRLCVTPQTAAHQAPPSLGFSRQEHWSGLPFPSPRHESKVAQSCPTLCDPMDCSLPGFSVHGIFQARVLE